MKNSDVLKAKSTFNKVFLWSRLIFCFGVILLLGAGIVGVKAQGGSVGKNIQSLADESERKLSFRLQLLAQPVIGMQSAETQAEMLSLPASGPGSLIKDEDGEVLVYIRINDVSAANLQAITDAGADIVHVAEEYRTITAYVGFDRLTIVAGVNAVEAVQEVLTPQTSGVIIQDQNVAGAVPASPQAQAGCGSATTSEGDIQLNAANARTTYSLDGTGVTVGILSDSYDDHSGTPATDAAADIASGDLPGSGNPCGRTTSVNVIKEGSSNKDEGRAMLQIVHDLAPGANLAFASAMSGQFDFADQIRALQNNAGAHVIADDIFYFADPFFQDGPITQGIKDVTIAGALYFTLAGNHHKVIGGQDIGSYETSVYRPMTCSPISAITQGDCHDFNPASGIDNRSSFTLANGGKLTLDFQWAEPWYGVQTDLDIYLVDGSNTVLAQSLYDNPVTTQMPFEYFSYTNNTGSTQTVFLVVNRWSGTGAPRLKYILLQDTSGLTSVEYDASNSTDTFGPTVYGHSGAIETISVAAVHYYDSNTPESFSSRGFPTYYFGPVVGTTPAGSLFTPETRQKPDVGATNRGRNTFFGYWDAPYYRFAGTSAASPHAAAVAALMKQRANQLERVLNQSIAESILETTATTMSSGSAQANGAGLVNALAATSSVNYTIPLQKVYLPIVLKN